MIVNITGTFLDVERYEEELQDKARISIELIGRPSSIYYQLNFYDDNIEEIVEALYPLLIEEYLIWLGYDLEISPEIEHEIKKKMKVYIGMCSSVCPIINLESLFKLHSPFFGGDIA